MSFGPGLQGFHSCRPGQCNWACAIGLPLLLFALAFRREEDGVDEARSGRLLLGAASVDAAEVALTRLSTRTSHMTVGPSELL